MQWAVCASLLAGSMALAAGAVAAPGGQGNGNGPAGSPGNPHQSGTKGNPHQSGSKGNPHPGSPPYGSAVGQLSSAGANGGGPDNPNANPNNNGEGPGSNNGGGQPHTLICHATGSKTNPFVVISPANPGVQNGHAGHQDGRDIIPAPPGATKGPHANGCTQGQSSTPVTPPTQQVLGTVVSGGSPQQAVAGETVGSGPAAVSAASASGAQGSLPFTGLAAMTLASIGVVLLFGGWLVRALGLRQNPESS